MKRKLMKGNRNAITQVLRQRRKRRPSGRAPHRPFAFRNSVQFFSLTLSVCMANLVVVRTCTIPYIRACMNYEKYVEGSPRVANLHLENLCSLYCGGMSHPQSNLFVSRANLHDRGVTARNLKSRLLFPFSPTVSRYTTFIGRAYVRAEKLRGYGCAVVEYCYCACAKGLKQVLRMRSARLVDYL